MAIQPIIPTYNHAGVPVAATFDLGNHTVENAADNSIALISHSSDLEASSAAIDAASLDTDEAYRLLMILSTLFV